tara:strand:- start:151 stop:636 length:486 start_codon:yes stop_codon:yes gene_type:complete
MIYSLPITKEEVMTLQEGNLKRNDNTWVDGKVYYKNNKSVLFHLNEKNEVITMCIPEENIYLDYDMNTRNLKSIVYTSTCWSDDWTRYDFNDSGNLFHIEERAYGHNRCAHIDVENNVISDIKFLGRTFGTYFEGYEFIPESDFSDAFQKFNSYFKNNDKN